MGGKREDRMKKWGNVMGGSGGDKEKGERYVEKGE